MKIGDVIASYRKENAITQEEFAKSIGVTVTYLSLVENDKRKPALPLLEKIATILGVSFTELVFIALKKKKPKSKKDLEIFRHI
jgi:transcriptional regulator with XRE-family HTH domain